MIIDIPTFRGIYTNADAEDIKSEYCKDLVNYEPKLTKLVKLTGYGEALGGLTISSFTSYFTNAFDFISSKLESPNSGELVIFVLQNKTTGVFKPYCADEGDTLALLSGISQFTKEEFVYLGYHASDIKNPVVAIGNVLRVICGAKGYNGDNLITNAWIGWIDRYMFNYRYTIPAGFYIYKAPVPANIDDLSFSITSRVIDSSGTADETTYYYKYSLVYDFIQEGLLSDIIDSIVLDGTEGAVIETTLSNASDYKRLTAINIYRSEYKQRNYDLIDIIKISGNIETPISGGDGACLKKLFFDSSDIENYNFQDTSYYLTVEIAPGDRIWLGLVKFEETGTGHKILTTDMDNTWWNNYFNGANASNAVSSWKLENDTQTATIAEGTGDTLQWGYRVLTFTTTPEEAALITTDHVLHIFDFGEYVINNIIYDDDGNVSISVNADIIGDYAIRFEDESWLLLPELVEETTYMESYDSTTDVAVYNTNDDRLTGLGEHPLAGEVSAQVNSKFGLYYSGRMFQIDSILDPEGRNEDRDDLIMYSEYLQPDIMPVSNAIPCYDNIGGETMGMEILFNNVIVLKNHTIFMLTVRDITQPTSWELQESPHNIGCTGPNAHIVAGGALYVAYYDGIYEFKPNMLAESDRTPSEGAKISEPINDTYLELSDSVKESLNLIYDKIRNELIVCDFSSNVRYCYNLFRKTWRKDNNGTVDLYTKPVSFHNEESELIVFDENSDEFFNVNGSTSNTAITTKFQSKVFVLSYSKYEIIGNVKITYKSPTDKPTFKVYDALDDSEIFSKELPVKANPGTEYFGVRNRGKKIYFEITTSSSTNDVEIYRLTCKPDESHEL